MQSPETTIIRRIVPAIDNGRYALKRGVGEEVSVLADIFKDGHDEIVAMLKWRKIGAKKWSESPLLALGNDRWSGKFNVATEGTWEFAIEAWGDAFFSWCHEVQKKIEAGQENLQSETLEGVALLKSAAVRAGKSPDAELLQSFAKSLRVADLKELSALVQDAVLAGLMTILADRSLSTTSAPAQTVWADRERATFAAWYEFFPRSAEGKAHEGSTFRQCLGRVEDAEAMGFDVIYFPPIHPIGTSNRKGRNNSLHCEEGEPGVPYAIGNHAQGVNGGGHKDVAPELGTLEDFDWLVAEIHSRGMEVALDFAINCSPDHPYVTAHPEWFFKRPDGSIKYAENPPKKYQDVYPLNFHNANWRELWNELRDVILFWCEREVRIFRVDNPHTKPVAFWEWMIAEVRHAFSDVVFLSEAFTSPKMMQELAKAGFTQSYTYFTWRNSKAELSDYLVELTQSEMSDFFRANFFTNTPDILPSYLQQSGRPGFAIRAILAALASPVYGIYSGFELCEASAIPGREEYADSEKYQFKARDWDAPGNIKPLITKLNTIRRQNRALHEYRNLRLHDAENDGVLCFSKATVGLDNIVFIVATLDPFQPRTAFVHVPIEQFGIRENEPYVVEDLLTSERFTWHGSRNFVSLDPHTRPAHVFRIRRWQDREDGEDVFA